MRSTVILATIAAAVVVFALGCGGGGGNSNGGGTTKSVQGIWMGSATSNASKATGRPIALTSLDVDFTQTGTTVTGTALATVSSQFYSGAISGTVSGSTLNLNINAGAYGATTAILTVSGSTLSGTYTRTIPASSGGGTDTGTISLTKQSGLTTVLIPTLLVGSAQSNVSGSQVNGLSLSFVQNGDNFTVSGLFGGPTNEVTGSGTVIGNTVAFLITRQGTSDETFFFGTQTGLTMAGTYYQPGTNTGNNGVPVNGSFNLGPATP